MTEVPIYQFVRDKLKTHGVDRTPDGRLILTDQRLFSLFIGLERAIRECSFDAVQSSSFRIEEYLASSKKRQLMAFVYLYLRFSDLSPKRTLLDKPLEDGGVRKCVEYRRQVSDEEALIGFWARVKYDQEGGKLLRIVYSATQGS